MKKLFLYAAILILVACGFLFAQPAPIRTVFFWQLLDTPITYSGQAGKYLKVNTGETALEFTTAGAGDITQVWSESSGDVATPTIESGEYLDGGTATVDAASEGILLPRGTDVSGATAEGQISWDSDNDLLYVGDGAAVVSIAGSFDSTTVDATTWSDGANASNAWTFDVSGTDHTMTAGNGLMTFGDAVTVTDTLTATAGVALSDGATITQSANNYVTITENSDLLEMYFDATNVTLRWSDGALVIKNNEDGVDAIVAVQGKDAGEKGLLAIYSDGSDKYIESYHDDTDAVISVSSGDLKLVAAGGDIQLGDENIVTTGTAATGVLTVTGVINTSVGIDAVGDVDFDIGSADVDDVTVITDGGTLIIDNGITSVGEDIGSATAEWNDLFLNDGGVIQLGNDQDVTITHVADTGVLLNAAMQFQFRDSAIYIASEGDGYLDIEADTGIRMDGPVDMQANALDLDSCTTTLSTVSGAIDAGGATSLEIPNGADPDVDAAGEISNDTDGANETGDVSIRAFDGTNQFMAARKLKTFQATVIKPNDLADATRDACPIWSNETGMTFTVTKIEAWSDTDDTTLNVEEEDADGANNATVDAVEIATNGTGMYYTTETTITGATIEANHLILLDFDDTDDPGWVKVSICGWFNADVN